MWLKTLQSALIESYSWGILLSKVHYCMDVKSFKPDTQTLKKEYDSRLAPVESDLSMHMNVGGWLPAKGYGSMGTGTIEWHNFS